MRKVQVLALLFAAGLATLLFSGCSSDSQRSRQDIARPSNDAEVESLSQVLSNLGRSTQRSDAPLSSSDLRSLAEQIIRTREIRDAYLNGDATESDVRTAISRTDMLLRSKLNMSFDDFLRAITR